MAILASIIPTSVVILIASVGLSYVPILVGQVIIILLLFVLYILLGLKGVYFPTEFQNITSLRFIWIFIRFIFDKETWKNLFQSICNSIVWILDSTRVLIFLLVSAFIFGIIISVLVISLELSVSTTKV